MSAYLIIVIAELLSLHLLSRYLNRELFYRFGAGVYLCIAFPGTVIHELSHLVGCLLTRTRVRDIRLFSPRMEGDRFVLGSVSHDRPRGPLSSFVIGTAPFWGGAAVLWLAAASLMPDTSAAVRLSLTAGGAESAGGAFITFIIEMARALVEPDWRAWLVLYLLISIPTHLAPSSEDLRSAAWGIVSVSVGIALLAALSAWFGWSFTGPLFGWISSTLAILAGLFAFAILCSGFVTLALSVIAMRR